MSSQPPVQVSPFHRGDRCLSGFVVSGRWPDSTHEWAQFLTLAVRLAAVPGLVPTTTVFRAVEDVPEDPQPGTVGLVTTAGPVIGKGAPQPGQFTTSPPALFLLHPPAEHRPSNPEVVGAASGCVFLPGLPHLGLGHRAAWVEAEVDGTVTRLVSQVEVDPGLDPDTAVLAMFLAA
jgi:hypothetical protein